MPPGDEDNKGGGKISGTACPPGGKINWDNHGDRTVVANAFHSYNAFRYMCALNNNGNEHRR